MDKRILHVDFNCFYASVECMKQPELRDHAVAVAGDPKKRHGIILAKNEIAKHYGVKTGEAIWQAEQKCPSLITVAPHFDDYMAMSKEGRRILGEYSPRIEPFGLDESWVDISNRSDGFLSAERIADEIRMRIKKELGITVSVGLADNKVFAKLGSDLKKPDAVTPLPPCQYAQRVWTLPVSELLFVGRATTAAMKEIGIETIGDLAFCDPELLRTHFGKWGITLYRFAKGEDDSPVRFSNEYVKPKSVGNGVTTPYDLCSQRDVKLTLMVLCESVAARLREQNVRARTVHIAVRDVGLSSFTRQRKLEHPTFLASELLAAAMKLFNENYNWQSPVRSITVASSDFVTDDAPVQITLWQQEERRIRQEELEHTVDDIRSRYGHHSLLRGTLLGDKRVGKMNPKEENIIFPVGYKPQKGGVS